MGARRRRLLVGGLLVALSATGLTGFPGLASSASMTSAVTTPEPSPVPVPKGTLHPDPDPVSATDAASKWPMPTVTFPAPGSVTVPVASTAVSTAGVVSVAAPAALGTLGLPSVPTGREPQPDGLKAPPSVKWSPHVSAAVPGLVRVTTLDQAARHQLGDAPMVFTVDRADAGTGAGPVAVSVDYAGFRNAYGGNYAERLQLTRYPACVLTTPELPGCSTGMPVANQVNNPYDAALTAIVDADGPTASPAASPTDSPAASPSAAPTTDSPLLTDSASPASPSGSVLAVTSGPAGPSGTYVASPLLPSAHWSVGLSSGSLGYSYPITTPVPPGGPAPAVSLDYDSGSVDGRTSVTNPQASWVGIGWDYEPGFIEREYAACDTVGRSNHDLCYTTSPINVSLTLGGMTTHLIQDADGTWRLQDDPGWSVTHGTGANNDDATGEFWRLQSPDGTMYYFGRGVGVAGTTATNSAWYVPVFGYPGTACTTYCNKAWRWNLDYVVRTNNNETTYSYARETNAYNVNGVAVAQIYVRGGRLSTITYGMRDGDTATPLDKVVFSTVGRCVQHMSGGTVACPTLGQANASSYPDVPVDLVCVVGATQCQQSSPSFWITNMLTNIDTYVLSGASYGWLDDYALQQTLPDPDGSGPESPAVWMSQVRHTGENGSPVALPPFKLYGSAFANRFDIAAGVSPVDMYRVTQFENETGGYLEARYETPDPCTAELELGDHSKNYLDCFPVHWVPKGSTTWAAGWFNKYLVTRTGQYIPYVTETPHTDPVAVTSEPIVTDYGYVGGAAWHKNAFEVNPTLNDSWNVYRGYQTVRVSELEVSNDVIGSSYESVTVHQFYRGMYGDKNNDGTIKLNAVSTAEWGPVNDDAWLAGREAEVLTETAGSTVLATTDTSYWVDQTAAMTMPDPNPTEFAEEVRPTLTMIRTPNADGSIRRHEIVDVHYQSTDPRGISNGAVITHVDAGDMSGNDAEANCTNTVYVANSARYLMAPEIVETDAGRASESSCLGAVLGHQEYFYDQTSDSSTPPTQGNLRRAKVQLTGTAYADNYATYDVYGRVLTATDANGRVSTTLYTPTSGRPTSVEVDSPVLASLNGAKLVTKSDLDIRGLATATTDPNGNIAKQKYDALGRLTVAYAPTESGGTTPTFIASYGVHNDQMSSVETKNLITSGGVYRDTWTYLDGWQRVREVHTSSYGVLGHLTEQTRYDDIGEVAASSSPYLSPGVINAGPDFTPPGSAPLEVDSGYDPLHRVTSQARTVQGAQSWGRTTTTYKADQIVITPPSPAPITTATVDVWGRPRVSTETSQIGATLSSATSNRYDGLGRLVSVADAAGKTNTYVYDIGGRRVSATDADAGGSTSTYDAVGNLLTTTDARGDTVTTTYDEINRPTRVSADGHTNAVFTGALIDYAYDSVAANGKGRPASVTVHDLGNGTGNWTSTVGGYDADGRVLSATYVLPPVSGQSAGISYQTSATYKPDGQPATVTEGALGDQPTETLTYGYDTTGGVTGLPLSLSGPAGVSAATTYDTYNQLATRTLGASGVGQTVRSYSFTDPLRRLFEITTTANNGGGAVTVQDDAYSYDNANNPLEIDDNLAASPDLDQQTCFTYDGLDRLAKAWTQAANCSNWTATTAAAPYGFNQQYAYNPNGTPASVTNLGGTAASYHADDATHPHAITSFGANAYVYDADGQQASRTVGGVATTLSWDPLHHLYKSATSAGTTKYVNASDGSRIARLDADGSTTIWVAGNEVRVANGVATDTRYYGIGGATVGVRSGGVLTWLASDGQNSRQLAVNATTGAATRTYYLPYGAVRTGAPPLPTDQNFLGRVLDSSGLLQDGARYYDPTLGQFLTPDPLANTADSMTLDPYGYAADNPAAFADPTGLVNQSNSGGGCGSMSFSDCASVEQGVAAYTKVMDEMPAPNLMDSIGNVLDKVGDDIADVAVQGINDTKDTLVGAVNGVKDAFVSILGPLSAVGCGPSCALDGPPPPLISDVPDLSVPDVPLPRPFHGPKAVLHVGGAVISLVVPVGIARLGKLLRFSKAAEGGLATESNVARVTSHLSRLDHSPANDAMLARIRGAIADGRPLSTADQNFMTHELTEAELMDGGMGWPEAHEIAGRTHPTYGNYDPEVIKQFSELFNQHWRDYWGIG
jgi:RHS repeat-associated protein